jgi:heterodisulfide reductase subunit C
MEEKIKESDAKPTVEFPIIEAEEFDPDFKYEIAKQPGGDNIMRCFACGTCSATCPVGAVDERYDPRKIIRMSLLGMRKEVLSSDLIWLCANCYGCLELCPQDARLTDIITAIRNIAVKEGYAHPSLKLIVKLLEQHGRIIEMGEFENKLRSKLGLPEIQEKAEEIKKLLENTNIAKIIGGGE